MLVDVWHEQKHAWPLQEAWITRKRREKRKNGLKLNFLSFPSLFFSLSLLSLSFMSIFFFTYTREEAAIVFLYVCFPKTRNLSSLLMTLQEASYITQILDIFVKAKLHAMVNFNFSFFETLIQELVTHCHYYLVRECHVLQFLLQNCTCPHRQDGATGCQPSMAASFWMKRLTHCRQWDDNETSKSWSALIYRSRKIRSPTVRQCTFLQRNLAGTSSQMVGRQPCSGPLSRVQGSQAYIWMQTVLFLWQRLFCAAPGRHLCTKITAAPRITIRSRTTRVRKDMPGRCCYG